jgi:hypothetical protein
MLSEAPGGSPVFEERRQRKAAEEARVQAEQAEAAARMSADTALLVYHYALLEAQVPDEDLPWVNLKRGEKARIVVTNTALFEPRRPPARWVSKGVSVRLMKGVTIRSGAGRVVPRDDQIVAIDKGVFVVTDTRCVFVGPKRTTEWHFAKLVGYSLDSVPGTAIFNVSNRQKASGVVYGDEWEVPIEAVIAAAIAKFRGPDSYHELLDTLRDNATAALAAVGESFPAELARPTASNASAPPPPPPPPPAAAIPAGWHPDPTRRFEHRYWDGSRWTEHVSTEGTATTNPL